MIYLKITDGGISFIQDDTEWSGIDDEQYDYVMDLNEADIVFEELTKVIKQEREILNKVINQERSA